jgi:hypothetical protein
VQSVILVNHRRGLSESWEAKTSRTRKLNVCQHLLKAKNPGGILEESTAVGSDLRCDGIEVFDFPPTHVLDDLL